MKKHRFNSEMLKHFIQTGSVGVMDLARAAGVSTATIYNLLNGRHVPSAAILFDIAETLGVPLESLVIADSNGSEDKSYEAMMFGKETVQIIRDLLAEFDLLPEAAQQFVIQQIRIRRKRSQ